MYIPNIFYIYMYLGMEGGGGRSEGGGGRSLGSGSADGETAQSSIRAPGV